MSEEQKRRRHAKPKSASDLSVKKNIRQALMLADGRVSKYAVDLVHEFSVEQGSHKAGCVCSVAKQIAKGEGRKTIKDRDVEAALEGFKNC